MWLFSLALAQECSVEAVVSGFPLGSVPVGAAHTVVATTDCGGRLEGRLTVSSTFLIQSELLEPEREGAFATFSFVVQDPPWNAELFFEVEVTLEGEPKLFLGGWYEVDPGVEESLRGRPELSDVAFDLSPDRTKVAATATVFPGTSGPEALYRWFGDGDLLAVTVSTQPRPRLEWVREDLKTPPCIRVEEIGYDGSVLSSDPRCAASTEAKGCGCATSYRSYLGLGWLKRP